MVKKSKYLMKQKVLLVADSVGRNVELNKIEKSENIRIRTVKAYSSVRNKSAKWPELNVADVTKRELSATLHGDKYDMLLLSAPTVDITNLDTSKLKPSDNTEAFKQEVIVSCQNMISVAHHALTQNTGLKKVILMSHPPRFDRSVVDPLSLKPALAKVANTTLHQLWLDSPHKDKIFIGEHRLDCSDSTQVLRYTDERTNRYDGIHMYGSSGKRAYTASVLAILNKALSPNTEISSLSSRPSSSSPSSCSSSQDKDFHLYCPQAQYMKRSKANNGGYPKYHQSVKDTNRFRVFTSNQGNC